jgi:hypothetical protein
MVFQSCIAAGDASDARGGGKRKEKKKTRNLNV